MDTPAQKRRAPANRTLSLTEAEMHHYRQRLVTLQAPLPLEQVENRTLHQSMEEALPHLPRHCVDLLFLDPPYNLTKKFRHTTFKSTDSQTCQAWLEEWLLHLVPLLQPHATVDICGDWRSAAAIYSAASLHFKIQNRITFEREKGRGARRNWKNCAEDIWFCTLSDAYYFNVDAVKMRRKVRAPYRNSSGSAKDWQEEQGEKYRTTHPSNLWTDITIPFWSMPENTDHPTQKPEKLTAKLILASSRPHDLILDPFLGSGTTSVVAQKSGRRYLGIEREEMYCCRAESGWRRHASTPLSRGMNRGFSGNATPTL